MTTEKALFTNGAADILGQALGYSRDWSQMLADMRRTHRDIFHCGLLLLPYGVVKAVHGKPRPVYLLRDIKAFIIQVRKATRAAVAPPLKAFEVEVDPASDCPWVARTVTPALH